MSNIGSILQFEHFNNLTNWSVAGVISQSISYNKKYKLVPIGQFLTRNRNVIDIDDETIYTQITLKINNGGVVERGKKKGIEIGTKKQIVVRKGQFIFSKIDARNGAFGIIPEELDGAIVTNDFPVFDVNESLISTTFLLLVTTTRAFVKFAQSCSSGTTNRQRIDVDAFLQQRIPLPPLQDQMAIADNYNTNINYISNLEKKIRNIEDQFQICLFKRLGVNISNSQLDRKSTSLLKFGHFKDFEEWGVNKIIGENNIESDYVIEALGKHIIGAYRGKSPLYSQQGQSLILNQKCNRWNDIDISYAKIVDERWLLSVDSELLTKNNDILINSTGEGTIGRVSLITSQHVGLYYDSHLLLIRVNSSLNPLYVVILLNSIIGQTQIDMLKSAQATKQTELGINNVSKIKIPVPNMSVQNEIVDTYVNLVNDVKRLKEQIRQLQNETNTYIDRLLFDKI